VRLSVELKEPGYEDLVAQQLANHIDMRQVEVISFNRTSVAAVKAYDPSIRTGLLEPQVPGWLRSTALYPAAMWVMDKLGIHPSLSAAARVGADFVSGEDRMVTKSLIDDAHGRGLQVYAWTVDDPKRMAELASHGVDGIVSNRPDLALAVRSGDTGTGAALAA
jgi:glycerophosphoryl diester phosphodiesterase